MNLHPHRVTQSVCICMYMYIYVCICMYCMYLYVFTPAARGGPRVPGPPAARQRGRPALPQVRHQGPRPSAGSVRLRISVRHTGEPDALPAQGLDPPCGTRPATGPATGNWCRLSVVTGPACQGPLVIFGTYVSGGYLFV